MAKKASVSKSKAAPVKRSVVKTAAVSVKNKKSVATAAKPTAKAAQPKKGSATKPKTTPAVPAKAKASAKGTKPAAARSAPASQKPAAQKITAAAPLKAAAVPSKAAPPVSAAKPAPSKPVNQRGGFKTSEYVVYPAHGVGRIVAIEEQEIAGLKLELFVITFEKDKLTLRVPTSKVEAVGMRKLAEDNTVTRAIDTLKGRARIKRTMWSRRAQEYEAKINSGDLISIAEVVRDLYRSESQPEQSYSERQLYEAALDRMAREIAAVEKLDDRGAVQKITEVLARSNKGARVERAEPTEETQAA
jgi:CarD family transcriptional regulator